MSFLDLGLSQQSNILAELRAQTGNHTLTHLPIPVEFKRLMAEVHPPRAREIRQQIAYCNRSKNPG